jgi:lipoprotein-anchoring transpeptidase ErfK/SrfK
MFLAPVGVALAACDDFRAPARTDRRAAVAVTAVEASRPPKAGGDNAAGPSAVEPIAQVPAMAEAGDPAAASADPRAKPIETSSLEPASRGQPGQPLLIKLEVLLDRANFSPGVIDGRQGGNLRNAITAFESSRGLPADAAVNAPLLQALESADPGPVTQDYVITAEDEKGPFLTTVPTTFEALAKLNYVGYSTPLEALAEKFHMSQPLLRALNPKADFSAAGTSLVVVRPGAGELGAPVAKVEVDKAANQVRAMDGAGKLLGAFPATVGSTERPAPAGEWAVKTIVHDPDYSYDPKRLTFGNRSKGALRIAPGPNNPVGTTWIALTAETYGIHGAPDPTKVGKTASHGCVRLTNWDAAMLGRSLAKGTPVVFVGETSKS